MCFEPRIVFACGCEKPKYDKIQKLRLCEFACMGGFTCSGTMVGPDPYDSVEIMYKCLECQELLQRFGSSSDLPKHRDVKSLLSDLKKKIKNR